MSVWLNNYKNIYLRIIRKYGVIDHGNIGKETLKKWTDREYHVQDNDDVAHKDVKMYCDTNQFPALPFWG